MSQLMIFGAGYSGKAIAKSLQDSMDRVCGTTRSADQADKLQSLGITPFIFDGEMLNADLRAALSTVTHLVQSIAPGNTGDPLLRLCGGDLQSLMPQLKWAAYLSTVGVYGNHGSMRQRLASPFRRARWSAWRRSRRGSKRRTTPRCRSVFCVCRAFMDQAATAS